MLKNYRSYETKTDVNFVPLFPSVVSRISVNKKMVSDKTGMEVVVMYMDGEIKWYSFNQFEEVLGEVMMNEVHQVK